MVSLINLPAYQASPLMDFSPIAQALQFNAKQQQEAQLQAMRERQFAESQRQFNAQNALATNRDTREATLLPEQIAAQRASVAATRGQESRAAELQPGALEEQRKRIESAKYLPTKEDQGFFNTSPGIPDAERFIKSPDGNSRERRQAELQQYGIDPASPEGVNYILNGKLSADAYKTIALKKRRETQAGKITEGLQNLAGIPGKYDTASFESAIGPFAGSEPDSLLTAPFANLARGYGEVRNAVAGGKYAPSEVRSSVQGSALALAQAIKPLIRDPGEGVWTDADQANLDKIVGNLAQARDTTEYRRRLNDVRDRIKANFGLDINFDALPKVQDRLTPEPTQMTPAQKRASVTPEQTQAARAEAQAAIQAGADRQKVIKRLVDNGIDPRGL